MRTAIIDRSLCGVNFKEPTRKTDVYMYAQSLIESGADYVEVDLAALMRLPQPSGAENYIFRIGHSEEYRVADALPFSYAVVPLKYSYLIDKIKVPVILEVKLGDADILALLRVVSESIDLTKTALLRLVGEFKKQPDELKAVLDKINMLYAVPIDLCPLNTTLDALSTAVAAYEAGVGSLTFSFGNSSDFASLEEFLISMATVHRNIVSRSYISGICKAAVLSALISDIETLNLKLLMKRYHLSPQRVETIDGPPLGFNPWKGKMRPRRTLIQRRLDDMDVEEELSDEIVDKLRKCGMDLYTGEAKKRYLN
ncbi:MAG: hypothetical protein FWG70_03830 [Oscillospiraceae bacterium]|nr:hypothetical protein [Oscillospiraceae bacterium]